MRLVTLLFFVCHEAFPEKHSLTFYLMLCPGDPNVPSYMVITNVEGVMMTYYNSFMERVQAKHDWIKNLTEEELEEWKTFVRGCIDYEEDFEIKTASFNQFSSETKGVPIIQQILRCELDNKTGNVDGFQKFGFDGEDFLTLDPATEKWIASNPQAERIKPEWDGHTKYNAYWTQYIQNTCLYWMKKYMNYGKAILYRTDHPSVSLLQKTPSSPVTCHASGFYPDTASLFWRKDGEEIHDGVVHGDLLPNHDGSFQISISLDVSSLSENDWRKYDCVFQFSGAQDGIIKQLARAAIRSNRRELNETSIIVIVVVAVVIVIITSALAVVALKQSRRNESVLELTPPST